MISDAMHDDARLLLLGAAALALVGCSTPARDSVTPELAVERALRAEVAAFTAENWTAFERGVGQRFSPDREQALLAARDRARTTDEVRFEIHVDAVISSSDDPKSYAVKFHWNREWRQNATGLLERAAGASEWHFAADESGSMSLVAMRGDGVW